MGWGISSGAKSEFYLASMLYALIGFARYCNMDYIFLSSIVGVCVALFLVVSYDIACQFFKNFFDHMRSMPPRLQTTIPQSAILAKVPKAHLPMHNKSCQGPYSFNYTVGVGRTASEGIETNWSVLNKAAPSVKEMGASSRREMLDDFCAFHNWRKTVGLGTCTRLIRHSRLMTLSHRRPVIEANLNGFAGRICTSRRI